MKIIAYIATAQNVTYLPPEVLESILDHLLCRRWSVAVQKDLWSCCLVARGWYDVAIQYLYKKPILSPRNFSSFANTLSPPVASRIRRVGLEDFVQELDMGTLAYESKKSTTARLISRTKNSLRGFVAPAVSFSTTCLAPLSRCSHLQRLDLSRDAYDFTLTQLMRSIKPINTLAWLNMPKDCMKPYEQSFKLMNQHARDFWPASLQFLQLNEQHLAADQQQWEDFLACLPSSLIALSFRNCTSFDTFDYIGWSKQQVPQLRDLSISVSRADEFCCLSQIVNPFPNIAKLIIPGMAQWYFQFDMDIMPITSWTFEVKPPQNMEILVLEQSADFVSSSHINVQFLEGFVTNCPKLVRIEVPEDYLNDEETEDSQMDALNEMLSKRAEELRTTATLSVAPDDVGVFTTESSPNMGVGLKRSFHYRERG